MKTISRYIMTLALLLTAVTGAWAQSTLNVVELKVPANWEGDDSYVTAADLTGFKAISNVDEAMAWKGAPAEGYVMLFYAFDGDDAYYVGFNNGEPFSDHCPFQKNDVFINSNSMKFYYTTPALTVEPGSSANTWTFSMPGSDVVLTPIYAKAAAFATTGTEPEAKTLLPEAAEGVIAGTDASLIADGTGIVALAGESTDVTQGTLMYAIGTSDTQAPALTDFSATVPTAENVADDGAEVYVWYYIKGADAPQGEAATLDNTFGDTEPACLTVHVLTNKFDIQLSAANANTIEADKATVTIDDQPATVTDGKLQGVKMGSEVKLEAKPGYKFRKVEVKKAAKPAATVTTAPTGAAIVGRLNTESTVLVSGGVADGGTLWYAVTTTSTTPTSTDGFSADVPTAKDITASGKVYVWYYVKGDDTHTDSEIAATAIVVPVADIVWDATNVTDLNVEGIWASYEKEGVKLSGNADMIHARWSDYGNPTMAGIGINANETGGFTFTAPTGKAFTKIEMKAQGNLGWNQANLGTGWDMPSYATVTWTGSAASTVKLLTDANNFAGAYVKYIAFYLSE